MSRIIKLLSGNASVHVPTPDAYTLRAYRLTKTYGVGGQFVIEVELKRFFDDESIEFQHEHTQFYSSTYGGPIVVRTASGFETRVKDPHRFGNGRLNEEWLEDFYGMPKGAFTEPAEVTEGF